MSNGHFFSRIGLADMEKIHSAVIGWIFSEDCQAYTLDEKSSVLNELAAINPVTYKYINSITETNNVDILITASLPSGDDIQIIIENKIKTSQHSNQLAHYKSHYPNSKKYLYLTLIEENAKDEDWQNVSYNHLHAVLRKYLCVRPEHTDFVILNEYLLSVERLVHIKDDFLENHLKYPNVFTDGWKKKEMKDLSDFIARNQLETIFQKMFFREIIEKVKERQPEIEKLECAIGESHGNAEVTLWGIKATDRNGDVWFDLAFQNGTFKIAISKNYWDNSKNILERSISELTCEWTDIFKKAETEWSGWRCHAPRSRPRISLCKNIKKHNDIIWYQLDKESIIELWQEQFIQALRIKDYLIKAYEEKKMSG